MVGLLRLIYVVGAALRVRGNESMSSGWGFGLISIVSTDEQDEAIIPIDFVRLSREWPVCADGL
jgi:hypothetical protein